MSEEEASSCAYGEADPSRMACVQVGGRAAGGSSGERRVRMAGSWGSGDSARATHTCGPQQEAAYGVLRS